MLNPDPRSTQASPSKISSVLSNPGSPITVPSSQDDDDSESSRELEHGSHDAKGGDDGNEYQAMWMTLACTNALYQQKLESEAPKVSEIILEGSREPFDDIEIRKKDGSLTLFQSKHRNVQGSGNILISELIKDPDGKVIKVSEKTEKKVKDAAPFSLLKYFRGMMKIIDSGVNIVTTRFILCASAPLSTTYKDGAMVNLGNDFWTTSGMLENIDEKHLEPLLTNIIYHDKKKTIKSYFKDTEINPKYVRFSDAFIDDKLKGKAKQLRTYLWAELVTFINKNRKAKAKWVTWKEAKDDDKIGLFFRNLQWWIEQPKLTHLDGVVKHQLRCNFQLAAEDIQAVILKAIYQSSEKSEESLVVKNIEGFFRCARGKVLAKYLGVEAIRYRKKNYFDSFLCVNSPQKQLIKFLQSERSVGIISGKNFDDLKFFIHNALSNHYDQNKQFGEAWLIVNAQTIPLYDSDEVTQTRINHEPEDLIDSKTLDLIVLDSSDKLPQSEYGNKMLSNLLTRINKGDVQTKLILISSSDVDWKSYLIKNGYTVKEFQQIDLVNPLLAAEEIKSVLTNFPNKPISFFQNQVINIEDLPKYSTFMQCLTSPSMIVSMISEESNNNLKPLDKENAKPLSHEVEYQQNPMPQYQAVYKLREFCQRITKGQLILLLAESDKEAILKDITRVEWQYNKITKVYIYQKSDDKLSITLKYSDRSREDLVIIEKCDQDLLSNLQLVKPDSFNETSNTIEPRELLLKGKFPRRMLVSADYGSGKSSLLRFLYQYSTSYLHNNYEWVISMKLSKIIRKLKDSANLMDIIEYAAQKFGLLKADGKLSVWQKAILKKAIEQGQLLLLIDAVDEVVKSKDFEKAKVWLSELDTNISFIIATRPHAEIKLKGLIIEKIALNLFEWANIKLYIQSYFNAIFKLLKNKNETQNTRHQEFLKNILEWLENDLKSSIEILKRPLHTSLLCQAIERYYLDYVNTLDEDLEQISLKAPWHDKILYRTKLYYLIIKEQLRKYIIEFLQVKNPDYINEDWRSSLLTQSLEIRLREIAFKRIFAHHPIKILHIFDEDKIDKELDALGFITHHGETEYRIFLEYYAAEYLLFCLSRDPGDAMCKHAQTIIDSEHNNKSYEEVWRILGEMIRYGNPSLNFKKIGIKLNVFEKMSDKFDNNDIVGAYWCFFRNCLNGISYEVKSDLVTLKLPEWFSSEVEVEEVNDQVLNAKQYDGKNLDQLIEMAKKSKNLALDIIDYLIANNKLTDEWLLKLYSENPLDIEIKRTLSTLKELAEKNGWPSSAWGGYWDLDVFFPALYRMKKRLYLVPSAYLMHRIDARNGLFSYGITGRVNSTFNTLISNVFEDEKSLAIFLMMLQTWLRQRNILRSQSPLAIIIKALTMAWDCFNKPNYKWVGIDTLFTIAFTFRLTVVVLNTDEGSFLKINIPHLKNITPVQFKFDTDKSKSLLVERFKQVANECDYTVMQLPDITWKNPIVDKPGLSDQNVVSSAKLVPKFNSPVHTQSPKEKSKKDESSDEYTDKHREVKKP